MKDFAVRQMAMLDQMYFRHFDSAFPRGALRLIHGFAIRYGSEGVDSLNNLREALKFLSTGRDVFLSVFSDVQVRERRYDRLFIDVDHPDRDRAFEMTKRIIRKLRKNGMGEMVALYSGSKGYHLYVPFEPVQLNDFKIAVMRMFKEIGLSGYDTNVIEHRRMSRAPFTINGKTGNFCHPVPVGMFDRATVPHTLGTTFWDSTSCGVNQGLADRIKSYDVDKAVEVDGSAANFSGGVEFGEDMEMWPKCMREMAGAERLGHDGRVALGTFLLHVVQGDVSKAIPYFEKWPNFSEPRCRYQLGYLMERNQKFSSCRKMGVNGLCPFEDQSKCEFAPNLNRFFDEVAG